MGVAGPWRGSPDGLVDAMLGAVGLRGDRDVAHVGGGDATAVVIADDRHELRSGDRWTGLRLERIDAAVRALVRVRRAGAMVEAVGGLGTGPPLWLVSGSTVLAAVIRAGALSAPVRATLGWDDDPQFAPVSGAFDLPYPAVSPILRLRGKVRRSRAAAEVVLSVKPSVVLAIGDRTILHVGDTVLPDTIMTALQEDGSDRDNQGPRLLSELVDHSLLSVVPMRVLRVWRTPDGTALEVEDACATLDPVPLAAMRAVPVGADPCRPWEPNARERKALDGLLDAGRAAFGP